MNLFSLFQNMFRTNARESLRGPVPGVMGELLARMGIHELGPVQKGTPTSVLGGCKRDVVAVPQTSRPAMVDGKPMFSLNKSGRHYQVMDTYGVDRKRWKAAIREQERKARGRFVGPFDFPAKGA
jgi:hypothetical protein